MDLIYARYNMYYNSIDITTYDGHILRIDCNKAEEGLKTTAWTDHVLNAMAIDNPLDICRGCREIGSPKQVFEDELYYICQDERELHHIRTEVKEQAGYTHREK